MTDNYRAKPRNKVAQGTVFSLDLLKWVTTDLLFPTVFGRHEIKQSHLALILKTAVDAAP